MKQHSILHDQSLHISFCNLYTNPAKHGSKAAPPLLRALLLRKQQKQRQSRRRLQQIIAVRKVIFIQFFQYVCCPVMPRRVCCVVGCFNNSTKLQAWNKPVCEIHEPLLHIDCPCSRPYGLHRVLYYQLEMISSGAARDLSRHVYKHQNGIHCLNFIIKLTESES